MVTSNGEKPNEEGQRQIKASGNIFFINGDLVRLIASNRGQNIVYLFNIVQDKQQTMLHSDFKKHRKRAYTVINTARLLDRGPAQIYRYINSGLINPPVGAQPGGKRSFTKLSYFSEDDIFKIREVIASMHIGRPRKDGLKINNHVLTEQELRAKMGDALMLYTRTSDGRFIPIWQEETY